MADRSRENVNGTASDHLHKKHISAASTLRSLLRQGSGIIVCPGVYDGLSARIALASGFESLYMTGAGTTMSRLGVPDLGLATLNDMRDNASMIASLDRNVPLIADADTGFGGPLMVGRTVAAYMSAGVAALHLEDQELTKRCGHLKGKKVIPEEDFLSRIRAAVKMREQLAGDIVIIARTDALQSLGYDVAVSRLQRAVDGGADVAFLEGISSKEQGRRICRDLAPTPVLLNMAHGGVTPRITVTEAQELGFKIVIFPGMAVLPMYKAVTDAMRFLKETGDLSLEDNEIPPPKAIFGVCGLEEAIEFDSAAGGSSYNGDI